MIDEEKLEQLLEDNYGELYAALQKMNVEDFIAEYKDKLIGVPGFIELYQNSTSNAPHNMTQEQIESYFDKDVDKERYKKSEDQLAKELAEKQRLAEEYQRAKDIKDFSTLSKDKTIAQNLAALGMKLVPQAVKNEYIKKGMEGDIGLQAGLGTVANLSEFAPGIGKVGKIGTVVVGPAIRTSQKLYQDDDITTEDVKNAAKEFALDAGINAASYLPFKDIYRYAKGVLGKSGRADKLAKDKIDEALDKADVLENAKEAAANDAKTLDDIQAFKAKYPDVSDIDRLKFADDIEADYPELAQKIRNEVKALAANKSAYEVTEDLYAARKAGIPESELPQLNKDINEAAKHEGNTSILVEDTRKQTEEALDKAETIAWDKVNNNKALFDEAGNLKDLPSGNFENAVAAATADKATKALAKAAPYIRGTLRVAQSNGVKSVEPEEKENEQALNYVIDKYKRQWDAGFAPRGDEGTLIMKAFAKYLKEKEGK